MYVSRLPPIQLCDVVHSRLQKPLLVAQRYEEMCVGVELLDLRDGRVREVVVVTMRNDDHVNTGYVLEFTASLYNASGP